MYGGDRGSWNSAYWQDYRLFANTGARQLVGGDGSSYFATYIMFDANVLNSLRSKTVTSIKLSFRVKTGTIPAYGGTSYVIGYKYNNQAGSTSSNNAWARGNSSSSSLSTDAVGYICNQTSGGGSIAANNTLFEISLGTTVPKYGYAIGASGNGVRSYIELATSGTATLTVVTNESDYNYTLSYNANGGSGAPSNQTGSNTGTSPSYTFTIPNTTPTRTGYTFSGWSSTSSGSVEYNKGSSITITSTSKTLYAVWSKNSYSITIRCLDPENSVSSTAALFDVWYSDDTSVQTDKTSVTVTKKYGDTIYINNVRPYYSYFSVTSVSGMTSDGNGQYHYTLNENSSNYVISIITERVGYTVSYNANGGSEAPASQTKYGGVSLTLSSSIPTRAGYTFVKWNTNSSGTGTDYNPSATYTTNADLSLYAIWQTTSSTLTLSEQSVQAGESLMIYINKISSSATHTITYSIGTKSGTIATKTSASELSWTVPADVVSEIPEEGGPCYISCTTYINNTQSGSANTVQLVVTVPSSLQPSVSLTVAKVNPDSTVNGWGILLQGYSKVTLTATATMASGATLASYSFSGPGVSYSGANNQVTSSVITVYGKLPWAVTVTDSRGRTATASWDYDDFEIFPYSSPSISGAVTQRTDSTGVSATGSFLKSKANLSIASCNNHNAIVVHKVEYTLDGSSWTLGDDTIASGSWTAPYAGGTIESHYAYQTRFTLSDSLGNYAYATFSVPAVNGVGLGLKNDRLRLGGVPTKPGLQVDWDAEFNGVVDITTRRAYATLNSAGWYRVISYKGTGNMPSGGGGALLDIRIVRNAYANSNETHEIKLSLVNNHVEFYGEESNSYNRLVDKVRYSVATGYGYLDIYYNSTSENDVFVGFSVSSFVSQLPNIVIESFQPVAASPSGESVLAEHSFADNGNNAFKTVELHEQTITSGYFLYNDNSITSASKIQITQRYYEGEPLGLNYIAQPQSGYVVIYCRTGYNTNPEDSTKTSIFITIDNR